MNGKTIGLQNRQRQAGMTTVGLMVLAGFVGIFGFAFLRLTPIYLNYSKVVGVVDGVQDEFDAQGPTVGAIRTSIRRRFDVESVSIITWRDVTVTVVDGGFEIRAAYEHTSPFISNISFTVDFDKSAMIRR
jgi:hypothetical protein